MNIVKRLAPLAVVLVVGLGWWGFNTFKAQAEAPEVGECVTISGSGTDVEVDTADCGGDVLFKVTADDGDCDPNEANYTASVSGSDAVDLCLFYDVEAGECVDVGGAIEEKVACSTTGPDVWKVVSVADDAGGGCGKREMPIVNNKRDKLLCVAANT